MKQAVFENLSNLEEVADNIQEINSEEYGNRMHLNSEYNTSDDALKNYIETLNFDEHTTKEVYQDIKASNVENEEIKNILIDHTNIDMINRREVIGLAGATLGTVTGSSYAGDVITNNNALEDAGQDHFEAPAGSYHERAVREMLEGEDISIEIYNIRFDNSEPKYDEDALVDRVENSIGELQGADFEVNFENVNATIEGWMDKDEDLQDANHKTRERMTETLAEYEEIIRNNSVTDEINADNSQWADENTNMASQMNAMIGLLSGERQPFDPENIKVVIADYDEGGASGVSTFEHNGSSDWALVRRPVKQEDLEDVTVHEIGHKLGLPHTKYPDFDRGGIFPDVMSYSDGSFNILNRIHNVFDDSDFGRQSHHNWEQVKDQF